MGDTPVAPLPEPGGALTESRSRRPVDLVHLAHYTLGNRAFEAEILRLFSTQSVHCLKRLDDATGDAAWRQASHTLKGSAAGIGAWRVARLAEAAEMLAGAAIAANRADVVAALTLEIGEVNRFIRVLLADA